MMLKICLPQQRSWAVRWLSALCVSRGLAGPCPPLILGGVLGTYRPVEVIVGGHPLLTVNQELIRHRQCVELSLELLMATDVAQYLTA